MLMCITTSELASSDAHSSNNIVQDASRTLQLPRDKDIAVLREHRTKKKMMLTSLSHEGLGIQEPIGGRKWHATLSRCFLSKACAEQHFIPSYPFSGIFFIA